MIGRKAPVYAYASREEPVLVCSQIWSISHALAIPMMDI